MTVPTDQRDRRRLATPTQRRRLLIRANYRCEGCGARPYVDVLAVTGSPCPLDPPCPDSAAARLAAGVDGYVDTYCEHETEHRSELALEFDHVIRWADGGRTTDDNLRVLCLPCHTARTAAQ